MKAWEMAIFDIYSQEMLSPERSEVPLKRKALTFIIIFKGMFTLTSSFLIKIAYSALLSDCFRYAWHFTFG